MHKNIYPYPATELLNYILKKAEDEPNIVEVYLHGKLFDLFLYLYPSLRFYYYVDQCK